MEQLRFVLVRHERHGELTCLTGFVQRERLARQLDVGFDTMSLQVIVEEILDTLISRTAVIGQQAPVF